jgi:phosphate starvation-inducible PhoH-like protein
MGANSKIVVTGDVTQVDLPTGVTSGLTDAVRRLSRVPGVAVVRMAPSDIVRHPLVEAIVKAYDEGSGHEVPPRNSAHGAETGDSVTKG